MKRKWINIQAANESVYDQTLGSETKKFQSGPETANTNAKIKNVHISTGVGLENTGPEAASEGTNAWKAPEKPNQNEALMHQNLTLFASTRFVFFSLIFCRDIRLQSLHCHWKPLTGILLHAFSQLHSVPEAPMLKDLNRRDGALRGGANKYDDRALIYVLEHGHYPCLKLFIVCVWHVSGVWHMPSFVLFWGANINQTRAVWWIPLSWRHWVHPLG